MASQVKNSQAALRFEFGRNWAQYLSSLNERRIDHALRSLRTMLEANTLEGLRFLDVGSGSGLFSLAARRLGARVHSFDYDRDSVGCTRELRRRYFPDDCQWQVEEGSALDLPYLESLGQFDVVYSWGVLHHTGDMWRALAYMDRLVAPGGRLFIAIYNDTGSQSVRWRAIKRAYNRLPAPLRKPFVALAYAPQEVKLALSALIRLKPSAYIKIWSDYDGRRGMSRWRDMIDWVGGYPYEVATPDQVFDFYRARGYELTKLVCGRVGLGCNQFVFAKSR